MAAIAAIATPKAPAKPHRIPGSLIIVGMITAPHIHVDAENRTAVTHTTANHLTVRFTLPPACGSYVPRS